MRCFKVTLAYDGTNYSGWQVQVDLPTVQDAFESALAVITGEVIRVVASGRTDAGVHALGQVVSFTSETSLPLNDLRRALSANTPEDIAVLDVAQAASGFHAIRNAVAKRYRYVIQNSQTPDVFARRYTWHVPQSLCAEAMHSAAQRLLGTHDFASFEASGSERASSVRTITQSFVKRRTLENRDEIVTEIEADGFLYNMVRNIVGTLVEIGRGKHPPEWIDKVIAAEDRKVAGPTAPPHGLFLVRVDYE